MTELYYGPALAELCRGGGVEAAELFDPDSRQASKAANLFPGAARFDSIESMAGIRSRWSLEPPSH